MLAAVLLMAHPQTWQSVRTAGLATNDVTISQVAALTLNGEAVLQPAGSGQREGVPAAHVGPVMLSAAMRHCMQLALPPPAPPIVQQACSFHDQGRPLKDTGMQFLLHFYVIIGHGSVLLAACFGQTDCAHTCMYMTSLA